MADDMDDIEDMLEAPYKNAVQSSHSAVNLQTANGNKNGNSDNHTTDNENSQNATDSNMDEDNTSQNNLRNQSETETLNHDKKETDDSVKSVDAKEKDDKEKHRKSSRRSRTRSRERASKRSRTRSGSRSKKSSRRDNATSGGGRKRSSRSRSRDRKRSSRSRSRDRRRRRHSRSSSRGGRRRSRTRSRDRRRDSKRATASPSSSRRVARERSPELTPEERDQRTVFCMQLAARIRPRDLEDFFTTVGKVRDVRLITDPRTKRSKGIAYIEFRATDSVPLAIALSGQRLLGVPIIVKLTQAEKNRQPFTGPHIPANLPQTGALKLYIGNLNVNISEEMLKGIFEPFGDIDAIVLARDEQARSKGFGFIQFASAEDGKKAIEQLNNFELAGKPMKVSLYLTEKGFDIAGGGGQPPSSSACFINPATTVSTLDNDELDRTGVNLGTSGKLALMAKLAQGTGLKLPQNALDALNMSNNPSVSGVIANANASLEQANQLVSLTPTQCFLLSNMFDLEEEQNREGWKEEIRDDVIQECAKYGGVAHVYVDEISIEGNIYIKCPTIAIASAAMAGLNGRYFAGKLIRANFIPVTTYHQKFPEAAHCMQVIRLPDE